MSDNQQIVFYVTKSLFEYPRRIPGQNGKMTTMRTTSTKKGTMVLKSWTIHMILSRNNWY